MKPIILLSIACILSVTDVVKDASGKLSINLAKVTSVEIRLPKQVNDISNKYTEIQKDIAQALFLEF